MRMRKVIGYLMALAMVAALGACGDDVVEGDDTQNDAVENAENGGEDNQGENNQSAPIGPEDCGEDELYNPNLGECVEVGNGDDNQEDPDANDPDENNQDPSQECEDDEVWDDEEGQCVPRVPAECGPGHLIGTACRPDGGNLGGAQVLLEGVDCDGSYFSMSTTADAQGDYSFTDVPSGTHEVTITSGSFQVVDEVEIYKGQTRDLTSDSAKICIEPTSVNIAVVYGTFDDIASLLSSMGLSYDGKSDPASFFSDMENLRAYDIIFVECGASWPGGFAGADESDVISNILQYVEEGHSLYASDLAYRFVDFPFGNAFQFHDSTAGTQTIAANVVSEEMQTLLGSTTTEVVFNMGGVRVVENVGPATEVQFEGPVNVTGGTLDEAKLMSIYYDFVGGGRAVYTSFHNSAQATGEMQEILEFMIFQL